MNFGKILSLLNGLLLTVTTLSASAFDLSVQKPTTLFVPNPPGGLVDTSARIVRDALSSTSSQSFVIENKAGGSGNLCYSTVAKALPDGSSLLVSYSGYHVSNPILMEKLSWTPNDFVPIGLISQATNVITVHPSLPVYTLKEFIEFAKQNPNLLNYASQGNGSVSHIGTELFKQRVGIQMTHVPYKGSGAAIQDVLSGTVQVFITTPPSVLGFIKKGALRALATTGKTRHVSLPEVPTAEEEGLKNFELSSWVGLFAPIGTPKSKIDQLSMNLKAALEDENSIRRAEAAGIDLRYLPPESLSKLIAEEAREIKKVIRQANIKID